ncbi:flavodoxin family protein [Orenia marismortui]|uniref:NADPH-dependent FMN reductase n=1 Tax=Orenia marismortui TaxID=46469 RepID=A0A4R8H1W6_9FIRM|nr:flavodoxin family protein [Orenia marismortui]TDX49034.1 NADPH-dependent FMN reductase [Orenia marismortui]
MTYQCLTILGSPNNHGNNALILNKVIEGIKENNPNIKFTNIKINNLNINPCSACSNCEQKKGCIIEDDMTEIYTKLNQSDIIIVAAPLYFNSLPAQLKTLIDRCQAIWGSKYRLNDSMIDKKENKIGGFISTAGQKLTSDRFKYVSGTMDLFFKAINTTYYDNFFLGNIDKYPAKNRIKLSKNSKKFGKRLINKLKERD